MKKYFAYDPDCGFKLFETADAAQSYAQDVIDFFREEAAESWPESVEGVCWGQIKQKSVESTFNAWDEENPDLEYTEYSLEDVEKKE